MRVNIYLRHVKVLMW